MPKHAQPVPPIYQPEIIAEAAVHAALHARRETWIGWSTTQAILGQRLVPGLLDRYVAAKAWESQQTDSLPLAHPFHHPDNVDEPIFRDRGAHGPFDGEAWSFSTQVWVSRHRMALLAGTVLLFFGLRHWRRTMHDGSVLA